MASIRSYVNGFEITDRTDELMIIPNVWGLTQQLGLFGSEGIAQENLTLEEIEKSFGLLEDSVRGTRGTVGKDYTRKMHSFYVPHFGHEDYITPRDVQGKRAFGAEAVETLAAVRARKLERIRATHAATLEIARMQAITAGTAYAPNGTVSYNWYTEFGKVRPTVAFDTATPTTDIVAKVEEAIAKIQDNALAGDLVGEIIALCAPDFFAALISHATVKEAYKYYSSTQEPLRVRLAADGLDSRYRDFVFAGVRFIEYRGSMAGVTLVPAGKAYFLPRGRTDDFVTYFAPASKFDFVNTVGQEAYVFEYADPMGEKITLQSETNFLTVLRRPQLILEATK